MKYNNCAILCLLSLLIINISPEPIILKLQETQFRKYTTNVCIGGGDALVCDDLQISLTQNEVTVYMNSNYNPTSSITSKFVEEHLGEYTLYKDTIIIVDSSSQESVLFESFIKDVELHRGDKRGLLGLGRDKDKNVISPLYQMYNIANDKKAFYIDTQKGEIIIGTYPPEVDKRKVKFFDFSENISINHFRCKLDSVYFKSNSNEYKQYYLPYTFTFCLNVNGITVPHELAELIFNEYLGHLIANNTCKKVYTDYIFVKCKNDYDYIKDTTLNEITFIIESKVSLRLSRENLFTTFENEIYFLILFNPYEPEYTFGYPFFNKYVLLIDEDNKRFGIYSHNNK